MRKAVSDRMSLTHVVTCQPSMIQPFGLLLPFSYCFDNRKFISGQIWRGLDKIQKTDYQYLLFIFIENQCSVTH